MANNNPTHGSGRRSARFGQLARLTLVAIAAVFIFGPVSLVQAVKPGLSGKIAFTSARDGNNEIYTINTDLTGLTRLTETEASDSDPTWSPYDTALARIAYVSNPLGNTDIYTMDGANGANRTRLTTDEAVDWEPSWSADGRRIAFSSNRSGSYRIYTMNADGEDETRITNGAIGDDREPTWSPDGTKIAFSSSRDGNWEIYTMDADGGNQTNITQNGDSDRQPSWSPDGTLIVFTTDRDLNDEIYSITPSGSSWTRLTNVGSSEREPTWAPDGSKIVLSTNAYGNTNYEIGAMDPDGTDPTRVTTAPGTDGQPDVQWEQAPDTTISSGPSNPTNSTSATFRFTSSEEGVAFQCQLDSGGYSSCTSPVTLTSLSEGTHTAEVVAGDDAGNIDPTPATHTWTIDTTEPQTTMTSGPSQSSNSRQATFDFSSNESGSTFECRLDSGTWSACSSGQAVTVPSDGSHTYEVRATDQAGNTDATPASFGWTVDTVAPETVIDSVPAEHTREISASFTFHSSETGAGLECKVDGETFAPCFSPEPVSGLSPGEHTFQVRSTDSAGNTDASPATYTWDVDRRNPDVAVSLGKKTSKGRVLKIKRSKLKSFSGTATDTAGIRRVKVALRISKRVSGTSRKVSVTSRKAGDRCRYLSLRTGYRIEHRCKRNYTSVSGTASWSINIRKRVQRRVRTNEEYVLYVRATDQAGNNKYSRTRFRVVEG